MVGDGWRAIGVDLACVEGRWSAAVRFFDDGHSPASTCGELRTRFLCAELAQALDLVRTDAERLGIAFVHPTLAYAGDGLDPEYPPPPGWEQLLAAEARRLGWDVHHHRALHRALGDEPGSATL